MKNLKTKLSFSFGEQDDFQDFNVDMKIKSQKKMRDIRVIEVKKKKKTIDSSTKLF